MKIVQDFVGLFFFCMFLWKVSKFPAIIGIGSESTKTPDTAHKVPTNLPSPENMDVKGFIIIVLERTLC